MATTLLSTAHSSSFPHNSASKLITPCPNCHYSVMMPPASTPEDAYARIRDLEAQVKLLNSKAAAAVDKLADYEDEVRFLRAVHARSPKTKDPNEGSSPRDMFPPPQQQSLQQPPPQTRLSSFSSFLPGRRTAPTTNQPQTPSTQLFSFTSTNQAPPPPPLQNQFNNASTPNLSLPHTPRPPLPPDSTATNSSPQTRPPAPDLSELLAKEHAARLSAEKSLSSAQTELEELTAQLFGQANEMVAAERKARARLEERVKILERRDVEKRKRLERLERALERIERVRLMVK